LSKTGEGGKVNEPASSEKAIQPVLNLLPTGTNVTLDSDRNRLIYPRAKPARTCKICGRSLKQKYYQICIYCRQQRKRQKLIEREIRNIVKKELNHGYGAKPK
jgi:hypothetical protein